MFERQAKLTHPRDLLITIAYAVMDSKASSCSAVSETLAETLIAASKLRGIKSVRMLVDSDVYHGKKDKDAWTTTLKSMESLVAGTRWRRVSVEYKVRDSSKEPIVTYESLWHFEQDVDDSLEQ